jgi:serine/threonine protein kinase
MTIEDENRSPIELAASEMITSGSQGGPSIDDLAARYPDAEQSVRELMPVVNLLHRARGEHESRYASKHSLPEFARPDKLGEFRIGRELGRGGMGVVFEAEQETLARKVALKVILDRSMSNSPVDSLLSDEGRTTAKLHHSNIVPVFSAGRQGRYNYLAMECIAGASLHSVLQKLRELVGEAKPFDTADDGELVISSSPAATERLALMLLGLVPKAESLGPDHADPADSQGDDSQIKNGNIVVDDRYWRNVATLVRQATSALQHAHAFGVLHRDIKPSNLLLDYTGRLWVSDFGLATSLEPDGSVRPSASGGTLRYMAPERSQGNCDLRSDIYSLGCTLFELVTLQPVRPFHVPMGSAPGSSLSPRLINRRVSRDLDAIILKAMANDPEDRYQTAAEFGQDLALYLERRSVKARPSSLMEQGFRWSRRNPVIAALMTLVATSLALIAVVTTLAFFSTRRAEEQVSRSLQAANLETERAERVATVATDALNDIFTELAPATLSTVHSVPRNMRDSSRTSYIYSSHSVTLLQQLYRFYEDLSVQYALQHDLFSRMAEAQSRIGRTYYAIGKIDQSAIAYDESVRLFHFASGIDESRADTLYLMVMALLEAGDVSWFQNKCSSAKEAYLQAYHLLQTRPAANEDPLERDYLKAACLYHMRPRPQTGSYPPQLLMAYTPNRELRFPWSGDEQKLDEAITILRALVQQRPDEPKYAFLLAQCLCARSAERQVLGEFVNIDEGIELLRHLVATQTEVANYRFALGTALAGVNINGPRFDHTHLDLIRQRLWEAEGLLYTVALEHPEVVEFSEALGRVDWQLSIGNESPRTRLIRAQTLFDVLDSRNPDQTRFGLWRALLLINHGLLNSTADDREKAPGRLALAIDILRSLDEPVIDVTHLLRIAKETLKTYPKP